MKTCFFVGVIGMYAPEKQVKLIDQISSNIMRKTGMSSSLARELARKWVKGGVR